MADIVQCTVQHSTAQYSAAVRAGAGAVASSRQCDQSSPGDNTVHSEQ